MTEAKPITHCHKTVLMDDSRNNLLVRAKVPAKSLCRHRFIARNSMPFDTCQPMFNKEPKVTPGLPQCPRNAENVHNDRLFFWTFQKKLQADSEKTLAIFSKNSGKFVEKLKNLPTENNFFSKFVQFW